MTFKILKASVLLLAIMALTACSTVGQYVLPTHRFVGAVIVSKNVNPTTSGRASPITLYFFQLKGTDTFNSANFFTLYNSPQKALGKDYVDMGKIDLAPGSRTEVNFALNPDTKYVGIVAAYQQLPRAVWRAVVPMNSWGKERVYVRANRLTMTANKLGGDDSTDYSALAKKASGALSSSGSASGSGASGAASGSSSASSGSSGGGLADKLKGAVSSGSSNSGSSAAGGASAGASSGSSNSAGGGIMQKYNSVKSAISGSK